MGTVGLSQKSIRAARYTLNALRGAGYLGFSRHLSYVRWAILTNRGKTPPTYAAEPDLHRVAGLEYSRDALRRFSPLERARRMILLLSGIPALSQDSMLIIGPRYEEEIFYARGLGWSPTGIRAIDLLTYSHLIDQGDMHSLPYRDESFAAVCCGWTLSYSREPALAAREISRVLRRGGYLALGIEVAVRDAPTQIENILHGADRIQATDQIVRLFPDLQLVAAFTPQLLGDAVWVLSKRP